MFRKLVNVKNKAAFRFSFAEVDTGKRNLGKFGNDVANTGRVEKWERDIDTFTFHVKHDLGKIEEENPIWFQLTGLAIHVTVFNFLCIKVDSFGVSSRTPFMFMRSDVEFNISRHNIGEGIEDGLVA